MSESAMMSLRSPAILCEVDILELMGGSSNLRFDLKNAEHKFVCGTSLLMRYSAVSTNVSSACHLHFFRNITILDWPHMFMGPFANVFVGLSRKPISI